MNKVVAKILFASMSAMVVFSCAKKQTSNTTGWAYNDKKTGGFQVVEGYVQDTPPNMVFIEGGTFTMGRVGEDILYDWNNVPRRVTVSSFYMDETEISNLDWREYVHWMRTVFSSATNLVERAYPDTTVWREQLAYNEPYLQYYFSHVAYQDYPVVGISWEQAMDYCQWRGDRVNELRLVNEGIIQFPDFEAMKSNLDVVDVSQNYVFDTDKYQMSSEYQPTAGKHPMKTVYGEERKTNMSDGIMFPKYRLPTEAEWEYAAYALITQEEENVDSKKTYPWDGDQLRSADKKTRGMMMANFVRGRGDMMGMAGRLNDRANITGPVRSYLPNDFGLYNMAGNVNEWVFDVYRPLTTEDVQEYNPFRGNEYVSPLVTETTVESGSKVRIPQIDSLGRVIFVIAADKEKEPGLYSKLDVRNYKDGDFRNLQDRNKWKVETEPDIATKQMYDPESSEEPESILLSKLSNTTRVYKGGSWRDRPYWLNPSTRRWLDQKERRNDIGFRCAMSKVGPEAENDLKRK